MQKGEVRGFNEYYNYKMVPQEVACATIMSKEAGKRKLTKKEKRTIKIDRIKTRILRDLVVAMFFLIICLIFVMAKHVVGNIVSYDNEYEGFINTVHAFSLGNDNKDDSYSDSSEIEDGEWTTILVNKNNPIPDSYEVELTTLFNGVQVDSRIYPELQKMFDDMRSEGIYPVVGEGYRSHEDQKQMMQDKIDAYIAEGYSRSVAKHQAKKYVAKPGYSEHELGIALDINATEESGTTHDEVYQWLYNNAYKYGFILRYPEGKEDITGIDYEPWHYRYVGKKAAAKMYESGLTLEEYVESK